MAWVVSRYHAGDHVEVRSKKEILTTLDADGFLGHLPFMPEMLQYCGKQFRVSAVAHKSCDMVGKVGTCRRLERTVHLEGLRCDGSSHGGCEADCNLFWRDEWLKLAGEDCSDLFGKSRDNSLAASGCSEEQLISATQVIPDGSPGDPLYSCQATRVFEASILLPWWNLRQYYLDVSTGNHSVGRVVKVLLLAHLRWLLRRVPFGYRIVHRFTDRMHLRLTGRQAPSLHPGIEEGAPTPTLKLDLKPGEYVRIGTQPEIERTLSQDGKNRGLSFDSEEMASYCGKIAKVRRSVTRIIEEPTGHMLLMKEPCIVLEGVVCRAEYASCRLNCPRQIPSFWREIWLERLSHTDSLEKRVS